MTKSEFQEWVARTVQEVRAAGPARVLDALVAEVAPHDPEAARLLLRYKEVTKELVGHLCKKGECSEEDFAAMFGEEFKL